jgi:hypothetical protein
MERKHHCLSFKLSFILVASLFSFSVTAKEMKLTSIYRVNKYIKKIKEKEIMHSLRMIVYKSKPNRFYGTSGHKSIQNLLVETLNSYKFDESVSIKVDEFKLNTQVGHKFYQKDFDSKIVPAFKPNSKEYKKWFNLKSYMQNLLISKKDIIGKNIIWEKKGTSDKTLVLTAHYDTVSYDSKTLKINENSNMPGADYNASSVAVLLGLIKLLNPIKLKHSIKVVFLDAQSMGFLGSYDYATKLKNSSSNIIGIINLEMLGHDSKHFDKEKKLNNLKIYSRDSNEDPENLDLKLHDKFAKLGKKGTSGVRFSLVRNNFKNSDNFRFWEQGFSSLTFSQNWEEDFNKKYQTKNDFPETINQRTLFHAFKYIAVATLGLTLDIKK